MLLRRPWTRVLGYWLATYRRTWVASAFTDFLAPVLFLAGLGLGLGRAVGGGAGVDGVPYAAFLAPGLLAGQAMQAAIFAATFPVFGAIKWNKAYHAMLATPLTPGDVVAGHLAFVVARLVTTSAAFALVASALGALTGVGAVLAAGVAVATGVPFAAFAFALSARVESDQAFPLVFRFVMLPLFLFSGTFFPLEQLPAPLVLVAWATPLAHGVAVCRDLALGTAGPVDLVHLAVVAGFAVAGVALALRQLRTRMVV